MPDNDTFFQQEILNRPLQKHGLLEELNLPPKAISFIRNNRKRLLAGLACLVIAILAWSGLNHYLARQEDRAASLLAEAMAKGAGEQRKEVLGKVIAQYSRTGAAAWAMVELGHLALDAGQYDDAARIYQELSGRVAKDGPLYPLIQLNLARAQEGRNALADAMAAYQRLAGVKGFAGEALFAMGRIYELQKEPAKAKDAYGKLVAGEDIQPALKDMAQARLGRL